MVDNSFSLSSNKVLSLGIAVADTFAKPINNFPKWNTLDTFSEIKFSAGGCAVNTGINLKNLGLDVGVAAAIGNDKNGNRNRIDICIKDKMNNIKIEKGICK